jgi:glutamate 5-kinase
LTSGLREHPLKHLGQGARRTTFAPATTPRRARKHWIAAALGTLGVVTIDQGAAAALKRGRSLLPAGVIGIDGAFERGDPLLVRDPAGRDIAKGLSAYDADDARLIQGQKTDVIASLLGYRGRDELIHRDDLVLL